MDSSFTIKPRDPVARKAVGRTSIVRTDLSPSISVSAAQQSSSENAPTDSGGRDPALHAECQALLDRERETRKRNSARKDEALLRQKAYHRNLGETAVAADDDQPHADFKI